MRLLDHPIQISGHYKRNRTLLAAQVGEHMLSVCRARDLVPSPKTLIKRGDARVTIMENNQRSMAPQGKTLLAL